ncbi:hypothetical protein [Xylophilus sp.]|uniref:hypothetical protein n=1 Tax=Xylophilus sp. TaxID=2653893 RepID=UPI0013BBBD32|nr:hypothetical protein [Xylophilus sp.]KAF1043342.1 MAG: hypothetical protein GAK38_03992 [Xylophilus sp.]
MNTATFPLSSSPEAAQPQQPAFASVVPAVSLHGLRRWLRWTAVSVSIVALAGAGGFAVGLVSALVR